MRILTPSRISLMIVIRNSCECLSTTSYCVTLLAPELRPRALIIPPTSICLHILSFLTDEHCLKSIFNCHTNRNVVAELLNSVFAKWCRKARGLKIWGFIKRSKWATVKRARQSEYKSTLYVTPLKYSLARSQYKRQIIISPSPLSWRFTMREP